MTHKFTNTKYVDKKKKKKAFYFRITTLFNDLCPGPRKDINTQNDHAWYIRPDRHTCVTLCSITVRIAPDKSNMGISIQ